MALLGQLGHERGDKLGVLARQVEEQALEVGAHEDVHRGRDGLVEGAAAVVGARGDEVGEHVVCVGGHHERAHGQAHELGVVAGQHVTEVARGHAEVDRVAGREVARSRELRVGVEVVGYLRHEAAHVDGVGARQHHVLAREALPQRAVGEDALDLGLGVVEVAADGADGHVGAALGGHLEVLDVGDLAVGVEDGDAGAGHVGEALERGLAGVAARGGHDHDAAAVALAGHAHELRQHLQGHVLEGARGAVPELEHPLVAAAHGGRHGGGVEVLAIGGAHAPGDLVGREVVEQVPQHEAGAVLVGAGQQLVERRCPRGDVVSHEQAAIGGDALENGLLACYRFVSGARAVVERTHCSSPRVVSCLVARVSAGSRGRPACDIIA